MSARLIGMGWAVAAAMFAVAPSGATRHSGPARDVAADGEKVARGAELLAKNECSRCHAGTGIAELDPAPVGVSCAGCHAWIRDSAADPVEREIQKKRFPLWDLYEHRVTHFLAVPDLAASGARLDP